MEDEQAEEVPVARGKGVKRLYHIGGGISLGLGVVGMALPLLPTTPFLLLSAYCFSRSSPKMLRWMMTNKMFGQYLRNYRSKRGIPVKIKIYILSILWITILASIIFATDMLWLRLLLPAIAIVVSIHILRIKTIR